MRSILLTVALTSSLQGAGFTVTTLDDESFDNLSLEAETADGSGLSLREALGLANQNEDADSVTLSLPANIGNTPTLLLTAPLTIVNELTFDGTISDGLILTISGNQMHRIFTISTPPAFQQKAITLCDLHLRDGNTPNDGGAILTSAPLNLESISFSNNCAEQNGGAMATTDRAFITCCDCTFDQNKARLHGGALSLGADSPTLMDCEFTKNEAREGNGGAIHFSNPDLSGDSDIIDSFFEENKAALFGGAVWNAPAELSIHNSTFFTNSAGQIGLNNGGGGAICNAGGDIEIFNQCTFSNNEAHGIGGAILNQVDCRINTEDASFSNNHATLGGGAIASNNSSTSLLRCTLTNNQATGPGSDGGAFLDQNSMFTSFRFCSLTANSAVDSGGALHLTGNGILIEGSTISDNTCQGEGGGALYSDVQDITINGSTFQNNIVRSTFAEGGAIFRKSGRSLNITNCKFLSNLVDGHGGAIACRGGNLPTRITGTLFEENYADDPSADDTPAEAKGHGGAIHYSGSTPLVIEASCFEENEAEGNGGGLWLGPLVIAEISATSLTKNIGTDGGAIHREEGNTGVLDLINSTFGKNRASANGGALHITGGRTRLLHVTVSENIATENGGGIILMNQSELINSVISGNIARGNGTDVFGTLTTTLNSLIGGTPLLGSLGDNGGPTLSYRPLENSPLIDAGLLNGEKLTDQRGTGYPRLLGDAPDIGAVEYLAQPYWQWLLDRFPEGTPHEDKLPNADPDKDGRNNAQEYLVDSDPLQPQTNEGDFAIISLSNFSGRFSYQRHPDRPRTLERFERSFNLLNWSPIEASEVTTTMINSTRDRVDLTLNSSPEKLFYRLVVTIPD